MSKIKKTIVATFISFVRFFERLISGHTEYKLTLSDFEIREKQVVDGFVAKKLVEDVKLQMKTRFCLSLRLPVVVELVDIKKAHSYPFKWRSSGIGKYHSQWMLDEKYHMIYILKGLSRGRFNAIAAHEIMHAFLYEQNLFVENQHFREAMARWAEYKILLTEELVEEAEKLLHIKDWKYGKGLTKILKIEKLSGEKDLIRYIMERKNS